MKFILAKYLKTALFIFEKIRYRLFIAIFVNFGIGILDGIGLSLFLPLLELISQEGERLPSNSSLGGMKYVLVLFEFFKVELRIDTVLLFIFVFFLLKGIFFFIREYIYVIYRSRFIEKIRLDSIHGIVELNYENYLTTSKEKIINTLNAETERVNRAYTAYFDTLKSLMLLLVYLSLAFIANTEFSIIILVGGILSNILFRKIYKLTKEVSKRITSDMHSYQGMTIELIEAFKYLKTTRFIREFSLKIDNKIQEIEGSNRRIGYYNSVLASVREPLNMMVICLVIYIQVEFLSRSMGGIVLSLLFFYRGLNYTLNIQTYWNRFLNMSGSLDNYLSFEEELQQGKLLSLGKNSLTRSPVINVQNLSFGYNKGQTILTDINLHIRANSIVGIVGRSGSGKSTLLNLILGLHSSFRGRITYNGTDIRQISEESLRSDIGYVSQESIIFNASLFENITLWAKPTNSNIIRFNELCKDLGLLEVVNSFENGKDSIIEYGGSVLSGGQRQKISIARELFKDPKILVLDEATASLDSLSENDVKLMLENLRGKYTILVIAHRLSTIRNVDEIYLIDKGKLVESGRFDQLYEKSKLFKDLVELQTI